MFAAVSLFLAPCASMVNAKTSPSGDPPIEQPLVREGDFAVKLATALNLTSSSNEAAAGFTVEAAADVARCKLLLTDGGY